MITRITATVRTYPWAALITAVYVVMGVVFSVVNPTHEATDELRHYRYVRYIADYGQLPVQSGEGGNAQGHHPPLYYATAALASFWVHPSDPLYEPPHNPQWGFRNWEVSADNKNLYLHGPDEAWPYRDAALAAHLARWVTVLWGAAAVALTYAISDLLFPGRPAIAIAASSLVALNPMFLYLGAAVNNDVPAGLIGAAITYACLRAVRDGMTTRRSVVLGVLYGLASLVKFNLVAMLAVIELVLLLAVLLDRESSHRHKWLAFLKANGTILVAAAVLCGWWYVRNTLLYGEPTGFLRLTEIWGRREVSTGIELTIPELRYAWTSLWGRFGYGQIPLPGEFYTTIGMLCGLGLAGLIVFLMRARKSLTRTQWAMTGVIAAAALVNFTVLYVYITVSPAGAMGRFFFPGLPAFAVLVSVGWVGLWPERGQNIAAGLISLGMAGFTLVALIGYLAPAYAIPAQVDPPHDPLDIQFGNVARILAYEVSPGSVQPGGQVDVTVTWEVLGPTEVPYAVFVHVTDSQGILVAQRDTYAGLGNYPSNWWRPGHIFTETYRVFLSETAYAPEQALIEIGLYHPELGRLPVQHPDARDSKLRLARITIDSDPEAEYPNPVLVNWDNRFALVGYTIEPRVVEPGGRFTITTYWLALNPPQDADYALLVHILQGWEKRAGSDGPPGHPEASTRDWTPGQVYMDTRQVVMPIDIQPGQYQVTLRWRSEADGTQLNIVAEDGHIIDNWLLLNTIRVISDE